MDRWRMAKKKNSDTNTLALANQPATSPLFGDPVTAASSHSSSYFVFLGLTLLPPEHTRRRPIRFRARRGVCG